MFQIRSIPFIKHNDPLPVHVPACKGRHCLECSTVPEARQ